MNLLEVHTIRQKKKKTQNKTTTNFPVLVIAQLLNDSRPSKYEVVPQHELIFLAFTNYVINGYV